MKVVQEADARSVPEDGVQTLDQELQKGEFKGIPHHVWAIIGVGVVLGIYVLRMSKRDLDEESRRL